MKLTRAIFLSLAFLIPAVSTVARADDKPAAAEGEKKAKKGKKAKKEGAEGEKKEGAPAK